jgi:hypothetical protein
MYSLVICGWHFFIIQCHYLHILEVIFQVDIDEEYP